MNQDFLLSGKAGMARRLVRLSQVVTINLDPSIVALAETDLLTDADFDGFGGLTPPERQAVQSLIDFDFRAVLPAPGVRAPVIALVAAKIAGIEPIVIFTSRKREKHWISVANSYSLDLVILTTLDADEIRDSRNGLLIVDDQIAVGAYEVSLLVNDFPKSVILCNRRLVSDLSEFIVLLSPDAPIDILTNVNPYFRDDLTRKGFKTTSPADLAFLLNIVTDVIRLTREEVVPSDIELDLFNELETDMELGHLRLG